MLMKFSFDFKDYYFNFENLQFAFRVSTLENVYGLNPVQTSVVNSSGKLQVVANGLQFAGGQKYCPGKIVAEVWKDGDNLRFKVKTHHEKTVKGITILIRGLAAPLSNLEEKIYSWPKGLAGYGSTFPFQEIKTVNGGTAVIMPSTTRLRFKRWGVYQEYSGHLVYNLSEDEEYTNRSQKMEGSEWVLFRDKDQKYLTSLWYEMLEKERGLQLWEERTDVPKWFRKACLILNMHCEGWTGNIFNTFDRQLEILQWIGERIEGKHVLVYLPGWDGRYYWNYPIYKPSKACGGIIGLKRLVDGAHKLGMHVIPMFGLTASNYKKTQELNLQQAACRTSYNLEEICDWTEWDEDLSTEPIWQSLNIGETAFRNYLYKRICSVTNTFNTDGTMLDISGWLPKDPCNNFFKGLEILVEKLHSRYKEFLIFGENGCEIHLPLIPLFHHAYNLDKNHPFFRYCRTAYHLATGAPGRGSTGVHELGINPYIRVSEDNPAIPTLSIVDDTLPQYSDEVETVIQVAKDWAKKWNKQSK
jgi:hypothetical protein